MSDTPSPPIPDEMLNQITKKSRKKNLVICESPAKIKKIQSFLGDSYIVKASFGHIRDLEKKSISVDVENGFTPTYVVSNGKDKVVRDLKSEMKKCDKLWLASDFDREGESIGWHVQNVLKVPSEKTKRIIFTEITKKAIQEAVKNPTTLDINMFYSQQARRVLDRVIGYLISPILWNQIQSSYKEKKSLSAGRVQSVVVKLIIERENIIKEFEGKPYYKTHGMFELPISKKKTLTLEAEYSKDIEKRKSLDKLFELWKLNKFFIQDIKTKNTTRKPPQPFITSTLQQEASSKLGISPKETMSIAQKLYENGHITYMRTDSLALSDDALNDIKKKVTKEFGEDYYQETKYKSKDKNSQEAHEACRPCKFSKHTLESLENITYRENRLYKLIWTRTVMSQMKPAKVEITNIKIGFKDQDDKVNKNNFTSKKEFIVFDGFLKANDIFKKSQDDLEEKEEENEEENQVEQLEKDGKKILEKLKKDMECQYVKIISSEKYPRPPQARFTEASLIKKLDELGIGRPSTYSSMVTTVQDRNYIEKKSIEGKEVKVEVLKLEKDDIEVKEEKTKIGGDKNKLFPTSIGEIVNKFLVDNFSEIIDYQFTAYVEEELDLIAKGEKPWNGIVQEIYDMIKPKLPTNSSETQKEKDKYRRSLGEDPETGLEVLTYIGKYGPLVQLKDTGSNNKFAPLKDIKIEDVTLEQALELLKYPKTLGKYDKKVVTLNRGQYGLYLKYDKKNYSVEEEMDIKQAKEFLKGKLEEGTTSESVPEKKSGEIRKIGEVSIRTGKYGPYFNFNGKNYNIPKSYNPDTLTMDQVHELIKKKKEYLKSKEK